MGLKSKLFLFLLLSVDNVGEKFWLSLSTDEGLFGFGCLNLRQTIFRVLFNDSPMISHDNVLSNSFWHLRAFFFSLLKYYDEASKTLVYLLIKH